ncbi:MAG TPA: YbhB/YbcL family Raf kinase inhibitor-like protein [Candidatus Sulfopaludibacter sp.]|nr:YbhB/YbcL family Raf kinase inhibitor-like protein [Candidatus Sulfopaludibacter sp.]
MGTVRTAAAIVALASLAMAQGGRGGRGGRGGFAAQNMTLVTTAWPDGGMIPMRYTQMGPEISPAIQWSGAPAGTASFVLLFYDADSLAPGSTDGILHWLLWNIPGTAAGIAQARPDGAEWEDGTRQLSASGFRYRGPGAPAAGPIHHYVMELYALDTMLDIKVSPQGPQDPNPNVQAIRASIMQALVGHVRGKGVYVGLFHRPQ